MYLYTVAQQNAMQYILSWYMMDFHLQIARNKFLNVDKMVILHICQINHEHLATYWASCMIPNLRWIHSRDSRNNISKFKSRYVLILYGFKICFLVLKNFQWCSTDGRKFRCLTESAEFRYFARGLYSMFRSNTQIPPKICMVCFPSIYTDYGLRKQTVKLWTVVISAFIPDNSCRALLLNWGRWKRIMLKGNFDFSSMVLK